MPAPQIASQNGEKNEEKLRILCLHGFRQSSDNFKGRSAALRKRLSAVADLIFIDGPFVLPHFNPDGVEAFDNKVVRNEKARVHNGWKQARPRRAWLVTPEQYLQQTTTEEAIFDKDQYQRQICGWEESYTVLNRVLDEHRPKIDGILGLSQGAAIAAALASLESEKPEAQKRFRFVILCSGYIAADPCVRKLLQGWRRNQEGGISMPSLHIHGASGIDRQLGDADWGPLAQCFDKMFRIEYEHSGGHYIPSDGATVDCMTNFLRSLV